MIKKIIRQVLFKGRSPIDIGRKLAHQIKWIDVCPGRPTVLALTRSQFNKDLDELRQRTKVNWPAISAVKVKKCQLNWVPEKDQQQTYFNDILRNASEVTRNDLMEFGVAFLTEASNKHPIHAVMAANVDYWQDEALKLACRKLDIPFLVLCRENYTIPWTLPWLHKRIADAKFKFEGHGVACFSEETKRAIAPSIRDTNDIWVTGAPRYDRWLDLRPLPLEQKTHVSLITFNQPGYGAQDVFEDVLHDFAEAATRATNPKINWLVKCKKRADMEDVQRKLPAHVRKQLTFTFNMPLFDLFPKSRLVIGYNSLAIVEAILADTAVVMPWWGQSRPKKSDLLLDPNDPAVSAVIHVAETPKSLATIIERAAAGEDLRKGTLEQRRQVFTRHLHIPQSGYACLEVEAFVRHYIKPYPGGLR